MRVLVTGASGFVGRHLCHELCGVHEVFGTTRNGELGSGVVPLTVDLATGVFDTGDWPSVDAIVHLAQSPRYAEFPAAASEVFGIAAVATQTLLDYALRCGAKRFVYASTGGMYEEKNGPWSEADPVRQTGAGGLAHYYAAKRAGELLLSAYAEHLDTTSARVFFCYGPGQKLPMLIPRLLGRISNGEEVQLQNGQGPTMNPIYIQDAVTAFRKLVEHGGPQLVNIAGPEAVTLRQICESLADGVDKELRLAAPVTSDPQPDLSADISRMSLDVMDPKVAPMSGMQLTAGAYIPASDIT